MKSINTFKLLAVAVVIAFSATSCVENSSKYQNLALLRDSIQNENKILEANYNDVLNIINEVEKSFQEIRTGETQIAINMKDPERKSQEIIAQVQQVKNLLAENQKKIQELQGKYSRSLKNNKILAETIKRIENELTERNTLIASLQSDLSQKNIKIEELNTTVASLETNVKDLTNKTQEMSDSIMLQDLSINTVWYCVATEKELKAANIISKEGLFAPVKVMDKEFDKTAFTQTDLRTLTHIGLYSRKAKVLSSHPLDSYYIEKGVNDTLTLMISDQSKFWSVSKYLVVKK